VSCWGAVAEKGRKKGAFEGGLGAVKIRYGAGKYFGEISAPGDGARGGGEVVGNVVAMGSG